MTPPVVRKRACRPKVRTGCRTCRARHIKCGEEKPSCLNCTLSRRECAGYDIFKPSKRSQLPVLRPQDDLARGSLLPSLTYSLSTFPEGITSKDGYALDYFFHKAFRDLPGSSWTLSWERLILPFYRSEPAILHATMAIGALQRMNIGDCKTPSAHLTDALVQYGRSAVIVRRAIENGGRKICSARVETILTASLLLFCFEILYDQDCIAGMHLQNGLKILHQHTAAPLKGPAPKDSACERQIELSVTSRSRMEVLTQTFVRLDADLTPLVESRPYFTPICRQHVPDSFASLEEAMVHIDVVQNQVHNIRTELIHLAQLSLEGTYPDFDQLDQITRSMLVLAASRTVTSSTGCSTDLLDRMKQPTEALNRLMKALASLQSSLSQPDPSRMLVEMHLFIIWFTACTWEISDEMQMDRFDQEFDHVMGIAEQYFAANRNSTGKQTRPALTIGSGVANTVCRIIEKSRNSEIRRRGIKLVAAMDMRGVFDGAFLASYYQKVVDMEETRAKVLLGLRADHIFHFNEIPAEARLMEVEIAAMDGVEPMYYHREFGRLVYVQQFDGRWSHGERVFRARRPFVAC